MVIFASPKTVTGIANVLLDLSAAIGLEPIAHQWLAPSCCWIAKFRLIDVVVGHGEEAHVDLPLLAAADAINRRARSA